MPAKAGIQAGDFCAALDSRLRGNDSGGIGRGAKPREAAMRLVLFESPDHAEPTPGLLTERGIVDISGAVAKGYTPQLTMQGIIDGFDRLHPALDTLAKDGAARPLDAVRLRPPLPRPGKI